MKDSFFNNNDANSQFFISYELLCLLRWLVENDNERLKRLITKAVQHGLYEDIKPSEQTNDDAVHSQNTEEIQYSIIEFFSMLETLLHESLNEHAVQKACEKNLMPAIEAIDTQACDTETVRSSVERASSKIGKHTAHQNAQKILFEELLKRWKPGKKQIMN